MNVSSKFLTGQNIAIMHRGKINNPLLAPKRHKRQKRDGFTPLPVLRDRPLEKWGGGGGWWGIIKKKSCRHSGREKNSCKIKRSHNPASHRLAGGGRYSHTRPIKITVRHQRVWSMYFYEHRILVDLKKSTDFDMSLKLGTEFFYYRPEMSNFRSGLKYVMDNRSKVQAASAYQVFYRINPPPPPPPPPHQR